MLFSDAPADNYLGVASAVIVRCDNCPCATDANNGWEETSSLDRWRLAWSKQVARQRKSISYHAPSVSVGVTDVQLGMRLQRNSDVTRCLPIGRARWAAAMGRFLRIFSETKPTLTLQGHSCDVYQLEYDGRNRLVSVDTSECLVVWDVKRCSKVFGINLLSPTPGSPEPWSPSDPWSPSEEVHGYEEYQAWENEVLDVERNEYRPDPMSIGELIALQNSVESPTRRQRQRKQFPFLTPTAAEDNSRQHIGATSSEADTRGTWQQDTLPVDSPTQGNSGPSWATVASRNCPVEQILESNTGDSETYKEMLWAAQAIRVASDLGGEEEMALILRHIDSQMGVDASANVGEPPPVQEDAPVKQD
eukprot:Selendium_serpulae@DN4121_c0_g1_i2.p1